MTGDPPLVQRFRNFRALSVGDEAQLRVLSNNHPQTKAPRRDLIPDLSL